MSRPRSGIGAELVPLALILAGLAGSLALIVAAHRRASSPKAPRPVVVVAVAPSPVPPAPRPMPLPSPTPPLAEPEPEPDEPEPPPPPPPEDPTPKAIARLTSAEAEQLLEASRADRRASALEEARKSAQLEAEKWRRRESLVRLQLDSLDSKVRKLEAEFDELSLERDALEKEVDARKAMASKARSRPETAILPHRGQNGTWRRPIVIECTNGTATLQPQGFGFGLLELSSGFGPASNPFVAAVAREAIRIQGGHSPDGEPVVPYIFFLVRPDGIRAYYEARGRLEPLGITFGYELADQDWEVDFPDLDDLKAWDGSPSSLPDSLARKPARPPGGSPAEDEDFPAFDLPRRGASALRNGGPGGDFTWPPRTRVPQGGGDGGRPVQRGLEPARGAPTPRSGLRYSNSSDNRASGPSDSPDGVAPSVGRPIAAQVGLAGAPDGATSRPGGPSGRSGVGMGPGPGPADPAAPRELALGGPIAPLGPTDGGRPSGSSSVGGTPRAIEPAPSDSGVTQGDAGPSTSPRSRAKDDPANAFVWPSKPGTGPGGQPADRSSRPAFEGAESVDRSPPVRHVGPFSRPLAMGLESVPMPDALPAPGPPVDPDPTRPDGLAGDPSAPDSGSDRGGSPGGGPRSRGATGSPSTVPGIGQAGAPGVQPPPGSIGVGTPGTPMDGTPPPGLTPPPGMTPPPGQPKRSSSVALPELPPGSVVDRRFEVVLVCGPKGVIVQPGAYRVTSDALKDRDGLLKKQVVALVKARRTADPKTTVEPRVRFLVQPGGDKNYWTARSQFLLSGLDWPISTQVADADRPSLLPSESW